MHGLAVQEEVKEETEEPLVAVNILRGIKDEAGAAERLAHGTCNRRLC
jgi:hypothetical protein